MATVQIETGTFSSGGIDVDYLFQPARDDRQHLIVIFSGFRKLGAVDYYGEAQRTLRANVLWIVDRFDDHFSYYLRAFGGKDITTAVHALIEERRISLGLTKSQVTLAGFSKGGSAALYYGIAFGYPRVVAAAPQYRIGRYVDEHWKGELAAMTGGSPQILSALDSTFDELVSRDRYKSCSVALLTSPADTQYLTEAAPLAGLLSTYENLLTVSSLSPLVTKDVDVTPYNVPLINALLILATEGLAWPTPTVGEDGDSDEPFDRAAGVRVPMLHNGCDGLGSMLEPKDVMLQQSKRGILEAAVTSVELKDGGIFHLEGYMFRRGTPAPGYGGFTPSLILRDEHSGAERPLAIGALKNEQLSSAQYRQVWVDYSHAGFASLKHSGFDLSHLPLGRYRVDARWAKDGDELTADGITAPRHETWRLVGDRWIGSVCDGDTWLLHSIDTAGRSASGSFTELTSMSATSSLIFPRGYFIPLGMDHPRWDSVRYAVSAVPLDDTTQRVRSFTLANDNRADAGRKSGEAWRDQSKATFSTRRHAGLDVSSLSPGRYALRISARRKDDVQSITLPGTLHIEDGLPARPRVGVIGSCVTRDNFSSRVRPGWKADFALHGEFYQSTLISFLAPPLDVEDNVVDDLAAHDATVTLADMRKTYRHEIARDNPDLLIVDTFSDARMGVIAAGGTWITDNVWKVRNSLFYRSLDQSTRRSFTENMEAFLELYREASRKFAQFLQTSAPGTRVVLNRARGVARYRGLDHRGGVFDAKPVQELNAKRAQLEDVFLEEVPAEIIDPMFDGAASDAEHPWGAGPAHYEQAVYELFRAQLRKIAGVDVTATWVPSPELDAGA